MLDLLLPVIVLIAVCIIALIWTGGVFDAESDNYQQLHHGLLRCLCRSRPVPGLHRGCVFTFVYYWLRGAIGFEKSMESIPNGFIQMISPS